MKRHLFRNLTLLAVALTGTLLALPNVFPSDPALLVTAENAAPLGAATVGTMQASLRDAGIVPTAVQPGVSAVTLRFANDADQQGASRELANEFPGHLVSFTSEPRLPVWLEWLGLRPMHLGLDLRGGVQFIYEVGIEAVTDRRLGDRALALERALREARVRASAEVVGDHIALRVSDESGLGLARRLATQPESGPDDRLDVIEKPATEGYELELRVPPETVEADRQRVMRQNVTILRNRVNALGLSEPVVTAMGRDRILVQVPGANDPAQVRRILSSTATIAWHLEDTANDAASAAATGRVPPGSLLRRDTQGAPVLLQREVIAKGEDLKNAQFGYIQGRPVVSITLDSSGASRMLDVTQHNVGRPLAVLLIEERREAVETNSAAVRPGGEAVETGSEGVKPGGDAVEVGGEAIESGGEAAESGAKAGYRTRREETVIFVGRIGNVFSSRFDLTGLNPVRAQDMALLLRSGALAAPIYEISSGTVSATLGKENIRHGRTALIAGLALVIAFMAAYYRGFGWIANAALLINLILIVGLLSVLPAALTLPGIAGVVLTVGMAVDANVLIFERIRESLRAGNSPLASIDEGYRRAISTIADANLTTLIAAMVLFAFGTGAIRGFAVTLSLGIMTSMLTAIVGTRAIVDWLCEGRRPKRLSIGGGVSPSGPG